MSLQLLDNPEIQNQIVRITREQYYEIAEKYFFQKQTELLEGVVLFKMPKSSIHNYFIDKLFQLLSKLLPENSFLRTEKTIAFRNSDLEPDISVVTGKIEDYVFEHPSTAILIVEVAKSSYLYDLAKLSSYAQAKVENFWILDINTKRLEAYSEPHDNEYRRKQIYYPPESISIFNGEISLEEIFKHCENKNS